MGAVAVGATLMPGVADRLAGDSSDVRAQDPSDRSLPPYDLSSPSRTLEPDGGATETAGGTEGGPVEETTEPTEGGEDQSEAGGGETARESAEPSQEPSADPSTRTPEPDPEPSQSTEEPEPEPEPDPEPSSPSPTEEEPSPDEAPDVLAVEAVLTLVNEARAEVGCDPLVLDEDLALLAGEHSRDMAERGYFSHGDPDGLTPWDRALAAGVDYLGGENIARGQADAQAVMDAWMNSDGHRANILNCDFRTIGIGVHLGEGGPWWTQDFGF
ncbi:CAP domain-containing protein [Streptomyces sp. 4N509B]